MPGLPTPNGWQRVYGTGGDPLVEDIQKAAPVKDFVGIPKFPGWVETLRKSTTISNRWYLLAARWVSGVMQDVHAYQRDSEAPPAWPVSFSAATSGPGDPVPQDFSWLPTAAGIGGGAVLLYLGYRIARGRRR